MQLLYELCGDYDLPTVFHLDDRSTMDEVGLPGLESMLQAYPDSDYVMHSNGWCSHVAADVEPADPQRAFPDGPVEGTGPV